VRLEGLGQLKNPVTSLGIEPMTLQLVAQCPNELCCYVPQAMTYEYGACSKSIQLYFFPEKSVMTGWKI
jgi:hypothetical protein